MSFKILQRNLVFKIFHTRRRPVTNTMIKNETVSRLRTALMELDIKDREIITLQHFRGMSYDEIADILKIPRGTVMSRLYYARKKLATLMRHSDE